SYMSELFNNHFNTSFSDVLNNLRINKAQELLDETQDSLKEIAHQVGYSNYSHFSKLFKKITHISPTEYKRGNH
ncbi:MAG TPA: helix-turn-helix domain-containing protein, partial [Erysipelothrix sp.]|nr:helix-turn-helix domain-containing protein [Erysipelothrix sp.]